ncbi:MAG TPA: class I SAM-dependent methyltransferase [Thermoanaerobaculaceae bacterium]|nr:class I SAM-dependent methyltransferase [Thermoanaerobaculaceae bacterium]
MAVGAMSGDRIGAGRSRPMLWVRPRPRRAIVAAHLDHVVGSFEADGWTVVADAASEPPSEAPLAVLDDPWVEPMPRLARALAAARGTDVTWRVPRVSGLAGPQGWRPRTPPSTIREYERRTVRGAAHRAVPLGAPAWCGFAVAPAGAAGELLARGWPPGEAAVVRGAFLYRYADPAGHERRELLPFVPAGAHTVVDVGCGSGLFGSVLRRPGLRVVGIEPEWELAIAARGRLDALLPARGEDGLRALRGPVDCVVFADVLEHTTAPGDLLRAAAGLVGSRGRVVVSFPNAAWGPVLRALAAGRWDLTLAGVQARDHLFVTTPASLASLACECGLEVETMTPLAAAAPWRTRVWTWVAARAAGGDPRWLRAAQWVAVLRGR